MSRVISPTVAAAPRQGSLATDVTEPEYPERLKEYNAQVASGGQVK
ncbi:MAG: hypothetical protein IPQ09_20615 [Myxococcales bacterium]|nr:hypothetical protein [Myxococcales bacterium]